MVLFTSPAIVVVTSRVVVSVATPSIVDWCQYVTTTVRTVWVTTIDFQVDVHCDLKESVVGPYASRAHPVHAVSAGVVVFPWSRAVDVEFDVANELDTLLLTDIVVFEAESEELKVEVREV